MKVNRRFSITTLALTGLAVINVLVMPLVASAQDRPQRRAADQQLDRRGFDRDGGFGRSTQRPMAGFGWPGSFSYLLQPEYHARDLAIIARELQLDQSQRPIIEALIIDYRDAFAHAASELEHAARHVRWEMPFGGGRMQRDGENSGRAAPFTFRVMGGQQLRAMSDGQPLRISSAEPVDENADGQAPATVEVEAISIAVTREPGTDDGESNLSITMMNQDGVVIEEGDLPSEVQERLAEIRQRMEQRRERMEERMRRWRERQEELEAAGLLLEPSEVAEIAREFHATKQQLGNRLSDDIQLMLAPWQQEQWPRVQQSLRRLNLVSQAQLSGEQVDLHHVIRDMHLSQHELGQLEHILEQYADELDAVLHARTAFLEEADVDRFLAMHEANSQRMLDLADREADRRVAVRTVNETYAQRLADALSEEHRDRFLAAVTQRSFPMLAQSTMAQRFFRQALELEELDDDQREAIQLMELEHDHQLMQLNDKQRQVLRESEPLRQRRMIEMFQQMMSGEGRPEGPPRLPDFEVFRERMELGRTYLERLRAIVPQEIMPDLHQRAEWGQWGGAGPGRRAWQRQRAGQSQPTQDRAE